MKSWSKLQRPELKKARIEIIPMIDTIFFLLVYFMFISLSMVHMRGMGVSLPKQSDAVDSAPAPRITVKVDTLGNYFVNRSKTTPDALAGLLQSQLDTQPTSIVIVNVDKHLPTQTLISVMDAVNQVTIPGSSDNPPLAIASNGVDQSVQ